MNALDIHQQRERQVQERVLEWIKTLNLVSRGEQLIITINLRESPDIRVKINHLGIGVNKQSTKLTPLITSDDWDKILEHFKGSYADFWRRSCLELLMSKNNQPISSVEFKSASKKFNCELINHELRKKGLRFILRAVSKGRWIRKQFEEPTYRLFKIVIPDSPSKKPD